MLTFNFVLLHVADPMASAKFYSDLLDKPIVESGPTFCMVPLSDAVMLGLWVASGADPEGRGKPGASEISFDVADVATLTTLHEQWVAKGVAIQLAPVKMSFGHTFVAADPDGHRIRVIKNSDM